jgi:protein-S-isoprenylcysteine O-methyltransferase Ste14
MIYLSSIWIFVAQHNMGNEWRIGIDGINKVNLITKGLFSISRNPIFLGVIFTFLGLFLIVPNLLTAIILFVGIITIQIQVRLEDEFLLSKLGENYLNYKSKTRRWV